MGSGVCSLVHGANATDKFKYKDSLLVIHQCSSHIKLTSVVSTSCFVSKIPFMALVLER